VRHLSLLALIASLAAAQGIPGFSVANIDKTADPCVDFYQYACGTWMANNPIPPDQSIWGQSSLLLEHNRAVLQNILEKAAVNKPSRTVVEQQIGDFYASCMD